MRDDCADDERNRSGDVRAAHPLRHYGEGVACSGLGGSKVEGGRLSGKR